MGGCVDVSEDRQGFATSGGVVKDAHVSHTHFGPFSDTGIRSKDRQQRHRQPRKNFMSQMKPRDQGHQSEVLEGGMDRLQSPIAPQGLAGSFLG